MKGFELTCGGRRVPLPLSAQRLMAFLALQERPLPRLYIAGMLWLDSSEERSTGSLRSSLWRLRRPGYELVKIEGDQLSTSPRLTVDVREISSLAYELMSGHAELEKIELKEVVAGGELLPGWYDEWVIFERERVRQLWLQALELLCERLTEHGQYAQAVTAGLAAVEREPLRESAQRALVKAHLANGNVSEARRQLERYRRILKAELGLEPSLAMEQLVSTGPLDPDVTAAAMLGSPSSGTSSVSWAAYSSSS